MNEPSSPSVDGPTPRTGPSATRVAAIVIAILAVAYTMYFARAVLLPITFAFVIALILRPLVRRLTELGLHPIAGSLVVVGTVVGLLGWASWLAVEPARQWITAAPTRLAEVRDKLADVRDSVAGITEATSKIEEITKSPGEERPVQVEVRQPAVNSFLLGWTGEFLTSAAIATVLLFFLLARFDALVAAVLGFLEVDERRARVREGLIRVEQGVSRYLFTVTVINTVQGIVIALVLWMLGMPNPIFWGIVATVLNYVPFIGAWTGTAMVGVAAILQFDTVPAIVAPPIAFLALTSIEGNLITPMILGQSMRLDPFVVFLSLVVVGWMWGVMGAILAVPLLAIAKTVCEQFTDWQPMALLIGGESPPIRVERLTPWTRPEG